MRRPLAWDKQLASRPQEKKHVLHEVFGFGGASEDTVSNTKDQPRILIIKLAHRLRVFLLNAYQKLVGIVRRSAAIFRPLYQLRGQAIGLPWFSQARSFRQGRSCRRCEHETIRRDPFTVRRHASSTLSQSQPSPYKLARACNQIPGLLGGDIPGTKLQLLARCGAAA